MFKSALIPRQLDKEDYRIALPELRQTFLNLQMQLIDEKRFPVIVVIEGVDGSGKADLVHKIYEWGDPHFLRANAFGSDSTSEAYYPSMWRYWSVLPPKGKIGFFLGSWYYKPLLTRVLDGLSQAEFESKLRAINRFEELLTSEGALLLKLWLSLPQDEADGKANNKKQQSLLSFTQWGNLTKKELKRFDGAVEMLGRITSTATAPWIVVPSNDRRYRDIMAGQAICTAVKKRLSSKGTLASSAPAIISPLDGRTVLDELDMTLTLEKEEYEKQMDKGQLTLSKLCENAKFSEKGLVLIFEGADAAGKGSSIRRVVRALDPRKVEAHAIAAPTDEEGAQPYLWRFWRRIPKRGHVGIFDRSWYGRVLVERVEGFCSEADWMRAYDEINDFEQELVESGLIIVKFWLAISQEEQLARFKARENIPFKQYKLTNEDWRNREKWNDYSLAVNDMVDRTSTNYAPWTLVEANCKRFARVKVLKTICQKIETAIAATA